MKFPPIIRSVSGNLTKDLRGAIGSLLLDDPPRPPVLVFGSQNSGTTIFGEAVSVHPAIANRSERALLWDRFHRSDRSDVFRTAEDAGFWDRVRIRGNFAYYHVQSGKPVILNKLPHNALRIHYLKEIFPDARLLHIVRDPRATVRSNLDSIRSTPSRQHRPFGGFTRPRNWREWLDRPYVEQMAYMWQDLVTYASEEGRKHGGDYREYTYEELAAETDRIVGEIWGWLGLRDDPELRAEIPRVDNRNYKWKQELTDEEVRTVERIAEEGMERFGYREA